MQIDSGDTPENTQLLGSNDSEQRSSAVSRTGSTKLAECTAAVQKAGPVINQ